VPATRAPRRPIPGLSVAELLAALAARVRGLDMLDGTPILDLKPYLSSVPEERVRRGWLAEAEARRRVSAANAPEAMEDKGAVEGADDHGDQQRGRPDDEQRQPVEPQARRKQRHS
jgi:hypothetical protein